MEILERGKKITEYTYTGRCWGCSSKLRANHNELTHTDSQRDGDMHEGVCPVCEGRVYFQRDKA